MKKVLSLVVFFSVLFFYQLTFGSVIVLKTGETLEGKIVERSKDYIVVNYLGVPLTYYFEEIAVIDGKKIKTSVPTREAEIIEEKNKVKKGRSLPSKTANRTLDSQDDNLRNFPSQQELTEVLVPFYLLKGVDYIYQGNLDKAEALFRQASMLDKKNSFYKRALKIIDDAKNNVIPKESVPLLFESENHLFKREAKESLLVLARALKLTGKYDISYYGLGVTYMLLNDFRRSVTYFQEAVALNPEFAEAHFNLGYSLAMLYDFNKSIESFWRGLQLDPENAIGWCGLGTSLSYLEHYKQAVICFNKGLEFDPEYPNGYFGLAVLYSKAGEIVRAKANFEKASALFKQQGNKEGVKQVNIYLKKIKK
ncbi:MAG: tetratricopeptide repeat protein [Candidatus Omnitrophica bacterium]|nr:tetratricopeptide repeat protein [Candidatus Omnitrophota bacterium]